MRHERKFTVEENFPNRVKNFLYENNFVKAYPTRAVNSIYYDTSEFTNFEESEEGVSERCKLRIRYYNEDNNLLILENKFKSSDIGWKESKKITAKGIDSSSITIITTNSNSKKSKLIIPININNYYTPSLFVTYIRYYFTQEKAKVRLTIDYGLRFARLRNGSKIINRPQNIKSDFGVLEIKYDSSIEEVDILNKLSAHYSLILSRHSKYCTGINYCY